MNLFTSENSVDFCLVRADIRRGTGASRIAFLLVNAVLIAIENRVRLSERIGQFMN